MDGRESIPRQEEQNLTNEDVVTKILENGDDTELERLKKFHNLTTEQVNLFRSFARLRLEIHQQMEVKLKKRKKENPIATAEELTMGAYEENIEPQVRRTVFNLRRKGYATYESGFHGFNGQIISFEKKYPGLQQLIARLKIEGIEIKVKENSIAFTCQHFLKSGEIENVWQKIEALLPDLKEPVEICNLPQAKSFREKQKII
ncbi:MAG: hypothetical protein JW816_03875 [Candidatus Buchananbacteria bacterium]|nr:hypothetical protein [Candidatus Buchananbacteria bacterium]